LLLSRFKERLRPYYLRWLYFRLRPRHKPSYFRDCWLYPQAGPIQTDRPAFLFFPMTDWHTRLQRSQHLARALAAQGHECLYLSPHLGREFPEPYPFSSRFEARRLSDRITELHVHLPAEPVYHHRQLTPGETAQIAEALEPWLPMNSVLLVSLPIWQPAAEELKRRRKATIVYDCHDLLSGFSNMAREIAEAEDAAIAAADLALFSSQKLLDLKGAHARRTLLLRNAVDDSWLQAAHHKPSAETYADYIGALDSWFDVDAIANAAAQLPSWTFRLVGRVEDERIQRALGKFSNIRFEGEVPHYKLGEYLRNSRVGLIPFLRNELTLAVNPIKLYEYFAYGLPVVTSHLPEIEPYADLVHMYDNPASFVKALEQAASDTRTEARRAVAQRETWAARAGDLKRALGLP
jgi:O-antigen biosynthesis protein